MKRSFIILAFLIFLIPQTAYAVSDNANSNQEARQEKKEAKRVYQEEAKQLRAQTKEEMNVLREETKASKSALRAEYKAELLKIRDERKRQVVEKFTDKLNQVNLKRVEHLNKMLVKLNEILARIGSIPHGSAVDQKIAIATEKLAIAQAAVDAQEGKTYAVVIASESGLRSNAGLAMKEEQSDLRGVMIKVNDAKKAIHDALRALKQEKGVSGSPSGSPTLAPSASPSATPTGSPSATPTI